MARVRFMPDNTPARAEPAESLLDAAVEAGVPLAHACGGAARCSTCRVRIEEGLEQCAPRTPAEARMAARLCFGPEIRLACQTTVQGDVTARRLVLDPDDLRLADQRPPDASARASGQEKRLAVLFADIRGFTAFSEALPAYDVIHTLSRYFARMDEVIRRHGGYIDNYMGDGLMALFGADDKPGAPLRAVEAALDMQAAAAALAPYFESVYGRTFRIGVGIHFGDAVMGTVAPPGAEKVTAIGDTVNMASRIESANKELGTGILVSAPTWDAVAPRMECRPHSGVRLPGKSGTFVLYEVLGRRAGGGVAPWHV